MSLSELVEKSNIPITRAPVTVEMEEAMRENVSRLSPRSAFNMLEGLDEAPDEKTQLEKTLDEKVSVVKIDESIPQELKDRFASLRSVPYTAEDYEGSTSSSSETS